MLLIFIPRNKIDQYRTFTKKCLGVMSEQILSCPDGGMRTTCILVLTNSEKNSSIKEIVKRKMTTARKLPQTPTDPIIKMEEENLRSSDPDLLEEESNSIDTRLYAPVKEVSSESYPFRFIPLAMGGSGRTHVVTEASASLMEEVSLEDLEVLANSFYEKAFKDPTLDKFIRSHSDPHGSRFARWIHQKLSGSTVWDDDRANRDDTPVKVAGGRLAVVHDRSSAHAAAWYSPKRPAHEVGRHFKLDEARVWMRLHFWALRDSGLIEKSPSFADYYLRFIAHFVRVYESTAPMFARDSFRWSADPANIQRYLDNGRRMDDVLGLTLEEAARKIPKSESQGVWWPYNRTQNVSEVQ